MPDGEYVDIWGYWDGMLSGLWVRDSGLYFFCHNSDDSLYPESAQGRCYDLWLLHEVPTLQQAQDNRWTPPGDPVGHVYEDELRGYPTATHEGVV